MQRRHVEAGISVPGRSEGYGKGDRGEPEFPNLRRDLLRSLSPYINEVACCRNRRPKAGHRLSPWGRRCFRSSRCIRPWM